MFLPARCFFLLCSSFSANFIYPLLNLFVNFYYRVYLFNFHNRSNLYFRKDLRASFCKYRESGDSFKIFNCLIFCPNKAFSELFSKIQLKDPKALEFFQNRGKFENRHFGLPRQLKIDKNDAFSFRSCW